MAASDVTVAKDGGENVRLHPYLFALMRWCVSCIWSAGTVLLHRLMVTSRPSITAAPKVQVKPRPAGRDHLHPEPRVECVLLHNPADPGIDVIFVHGLYGSLANTWRQGEWRSKYKAEPNKIPLRRPDSQTTNSQRHVSETLNKLKKSDIYNHTGDNNVDNKCNLQNTEVFLEQEQDIFTDIDEKLYNDFKKLLPNEDMYITESFYHNTLLDHVEIVENYETQAKFVRDLFEYENNKCCDNNCESIVNNFDEKQNNSYIANNNNNNNEVEIEQYSCKCKSHDTEECEIGCGCICDMCYSSCWPRDWIKEDYPNARVISINYTSDPHLWRPLWIKQSKRLRLHERAEQMIQQLLDLGVGHRPIIWVGHSKGGLFIKQIYCEAYSAYLTLNENEQKQVEENIDAKQCNSKEMNTIRENISNLNNIKFYEETNYRKSQEYVLCKTEFNLNAKDITYNDKSSLKANDINNYDLKQNDNSKRKEIRTDLNFGDFRDQEKNEIGDVDKYDAKFRRRLWLNSAGFMFYSVPHRGSPLADIKTPFTARSIELLEICKDCSLVLSLQERWQKASEEGHACVRSLVETCRTLMSVLWLRIVSVDSADAGIGTLYGVSLDHREICKPSSRRCLLYTELMELMKTALNKHH